MRLLSHLLTVFVLLTAFTTEATPVYVQAGPGSFNHAALDLLTERSADAYQRLYSGTPDDTYTAATENNAWAFSALANSTIDGQLVPAIVNAMRNYRVTAFSAAVHMPIEMCVFGLNKTGKITHAASHPAALKQISNWLSAHQITTIPVPEGTNEAARRLAHGLFDQSTVAIGSCALKSVYPELTLREKGIQDQTDNHTLFGLMKLEKRPQQISHSAARIALKQVVDQANEQIKARADSSKSVFALIDKRLAQMQLVALFKANKHKPIEDLSREAVVLSKALEQARQQCLDTSSVKAFFQAQMDAAKAIQYRYRAQWLAEGVPSKTADLAKLRLTLNQLGSAILETMTAHLKQHGNLTPELEPVFHTTLVTDNLTGKDKQRLYQTLQSVRRVENCQATD
ncbi:hypothetical protein PRUB_b0735 [Pseudoalteromonas rubra]|uniref:chorismate mutase n=1 Tax=Pseudoalteromonas rubra TaxID=43658 RepID=A0A8T0C2N0_9GAMM|nr:gamma subclass chorismate mutase AroQ [Pseudoalteromonas rubra]KAF7781498.1 hypothetical protein PRUB_b0735 [Pseudoalteromonas rubra]